MFKFHEIDIFHVVSEEELVEEHITKKSIEQTNSNSISFRCDDDQQDNQIENNTNYTDGSNSYEVCSANRKLLPYVPQVVCICLSLLCIINY